MALRSIWNATIAFAGVFVPIKAHSATEDRRVPFKEGSGTFAPRCGVNITHRA